MLERLYLDSETCGLHGMPVLLQYAVEDGPIVLYEPWKHPVHETLALIEWFLTHTIVGFNLSFDMFQLCKLYTVLQLCPSDWIPEQHINEIAQLEPEAQNGPCLKPAGCLDLMLHARRGPMQALMARDDIRIKRVPTALAYVLAQELEQRIYIDNIFFAKTADPNAPRWNVYDRKNSEGDFDANFKDVVLKFHPAGGLKFLAEYVLGYQPKYHFGDVEVDKKYLPKELGYAPTALAISHGPQWNVFKEGKVVGHTWPGVISHHIEHWHSNVQAREYANDDIVYTRALDKHFEYPTPDDDDSVLACMVAAVRWHGFKIDLQGIEKLEAGAKAVVAASPVNINKPQDVRAYLYECMDEVEKLVLAESTKKANLLAVSEWQIGSEVCTKCEGAGCLRCSPPGLHPAAKRALAVLDVKIAAKEVELYRKLQRAGKFHASFVIIGALSGRMSGGDGLNAMGIKKTPDVRKQFPLKWDGMELSLGDFSSFEVTLADAVYNDPALRHDLQSGWKIHAQFGAKLSGLTYEQVLASAKTRDDWYDKGKRGIFAKFYGGNWQTLVRKLDGVTEERAKAADEDFTQRYPVVEAARQKIFKMFCSMTQPGGIGSEVVWNPPAEFIETALGFRRYYTLENRICEALFGLARRPPKEWKDCPIKVMRRDRVQTAGGAVASALYGAAFAIQAASMRSAGNHVIQGFGAAITKNVQRRVWDLQPVGVNDWYVAIMQVHDELLVVHRPELRDVVQATIKEGVEAHRDKVPLIGMDWLANADTWADK
jgi:hypothetical protein